MQTPITVPAARQAPPAPPAEGSGDAPASRGRTLEQLLYDYRDKLAEVLPAHVSPDYIVRMVLVAAGSDPRLCEAPATLVRAVMVSASLGLDPTGGPLGEAYLVPFWSTKNRRNEVALIPGYRGLIDLMTRSGRVVHVSASAVYGDEVAAGRFRMFRGTSERIEHEPLYGFDGTEHRELVLTYAVAHHATGFPKFEYCDRGYLDRLAEAASARVNGRQTPWETDPEPMKIKSAIRKLSKYVPRSRELAAAIALTEASERAEHVDLRALGEVGQRALALPDPEARASVAVPESRTAEVLGAVAAHLERSAPAPQAPAAAPGGPVAASEGPEPGPRPSDAPEAALGPEAPPERIGGEWADRLFDRFREVAGEAGLTRAVDEALERYGARSLADLTPDQARELAAGLNRAARAARKDRRARAVRTVLGN